jgi:hypothetical protein
MTSRLILPTALVSTDWLAHHLVGCATCRVRVEAMQEAGAAYRLWMPLVPVLWLRDAAVAQAAERTSATTARVSRWRKLAVLAGAGLALLAGAGLGIGPVSRVVVYALTCGRPESGGCCAPTVSTT